MLPHRVHRASRRFVTIIPNIRRQRRMFGIDIFVLQRMFGKSVENFYEHPLFSDDRSEHPYFSYYEHLIFYLKSDDFLRKNECSERTTTLDVRNEK